MAMTGQGNTSDAQSSSGAITIRQLQPSDLSFADSLRACAGWNQTLRDWQRFLNCEPDGCFVGEWQGTPAATATTICYGPDLGWIGMLLVHPDRRRNGLGSALLQHAIDHLHNRGTRCIKLDATPLGRPLYERFGFQAEDELTRWESPALPPIATDTESAITAMSEGDLEAIVNLDQKSFGSRRRVLINELVGNSVHAVVHRGAKLSEFGYGMLREGSRAFYLGPVASERQDVGVRIIAHLLSKIPGRPVFWDVLDQNTSASALARKQGFTTQRKLLRMRLGPSAGTGDSSRQFAIADPAVG